MTSGIPRNELERQAAERMAWQGYSLREIAEELDIPQSTIYGWVKGALRPANQVRTLEPEEVDTLLYLLNRERLSMEAACKRLHIGQHTARRYVQRLPRRYTYRGRTEVGGRLGPLRMGWDA